MYTLNSFIRIFPDVEERAVMVKNPLLHKGVIVSSQIVSMLDLLDHLRGSHTKRSVFTLIRRYMPSAVPQDIFDLLLRNGLLVDPAAREQKRYHELWEYYNWEDLAYYLAAAMREQYFEADRPAQAQKTRAKTYRQYIQTSEKLPSLYKTYRGKAIRLPKPQAQLLTQPYFEALYQRRTIRRFDPRPLTLQQLSTLLHFSFQEMRQVRKYVDKNLRRDLATLSHSRYISHEVVLLVHNVVGLGSGVYGYHVGNHTLHLLKRGQFYDEAQEIIIGQSCGRNAAVSIFLTSVFERLMWRYRSSNHYKKFLLGVGELAQQIIMVAWSMNLGVFQTPAIRDREAEALLKTQALVEEPMYYLAVGYRAEKPKS